MRDETMRGGSTPEFFAGAWEDFAPWDIGRAQADIARACDEGRVSGAVLDLGCGSGEHALCCAARGHEAWGIDVVGPAVERARDKARDRGLDATFVVGDALTFDPGRTFDTAIDVGLFHALSDADRIRYREAVDRLLAPGGTLLLLCFSDEQPGGGYPRRVSRPELQALFGERAIEEVRPARYETLLPGGGGWAGARAWLARIRRADP